MLGPSKQLFTPKILPNLYDQYLKLALRSVHTGEEMNLVVPKSLNVSNSAIAKFSHICRDWRYNQAQNMDPGLVQILAKICDESKDDTRSISVEILSGFRTHRTNEMLRRRSVMVAKNSYHKLGKALDFRLPGIDLPRQKRALIDMHMEVLEFTKTLSILIQVRSAGGLCSSHTKYFRSIIGILIVRIFRLLMI